MDMNIWQLDYVVVLVHWLDFDYSFIFIFLMVFLKKIKAAGLAIGIVGDAGVRANAQQEKIFVGMILILIFAEALGLYGLIVALILSQ